MEALAPEFLGRRGEPGKGPVGWDYLESSGQHPVDNMVEVVQLF